MPQIAGPGSGGSPHRLPGPARHGGLRARAQPSRDGSRPLSSPGHTPLSIEEDIRWRCRRLVIGAGADSALPVMPQVRDEARRRNVDLVVLPTAQAIGAMAKAAPDTNAILHLTC